MKDKKGGKARLGRDPSNHHADLTPENRKEVRDAGLVMNSFRSQCRYGKVSRQSSREIRNKYGSLKESFIGQKCQGPGTFIIFRF